MAWNGYRFMGKAILGGARGGAQLGNRLGAAGSLHLDGRGARRGYLAPGDPTPPPTSTSDYFDYRGLATWNEACNLEGCEFPLGTFTDLQRRARPRGPIGLPGTVLNRHAAVIGPAGSGKTAGILLPWIRAALECGWSVTAVDVKGDMREEYLAYEQSVGAAPTGAKLIKWDFTDPQRSVSWDWIQELNDDARIDAAITAVIGRRPENSSVDPHFYQRDYRTLRGLLKFARATAPWVKTASGLMRLLEDDQALSVAVSRNPRAPGASDLEAILRYPPGDYSRVISGVVTALSVLDSTGVDEVTEASAVKPGLSLKHTLDNHRALFVVAPLRGGELSVTLSSLLLNQLKQRLFERFGNPGRPALLVIDEAAQVIDRVDIKQLMEVARSAGVGVVIALQDAAQLKDDKDRSSTLSNAASFVILPGASPLSVEEFKTRLGQRFERTHGVTSGGPSQGWGAAQPTQTYGTESVPVLREREIMQPPLGERPAVVHVKAQEIGVTTKPFLVDLNRSRLAS